MEGIQAILGAVKKHPRERSVLFYTISALGNDLTLLEANEELFVNVIDGVSFSGTKEYEDVFGRRWSYYRSLLSREHSLQARAVA